MPTSVAPSVLLTISDRRAFVDVRKFLDRNSSCLRDAADNYKVSGLEMKLVKIFFFMLNYVL